MVHVTDGWSRPLLEGVNDGRFDFGRWGDGEASQESATERHGAARVCAQPMSLSIVTAGHNQTGVRSRNMCAAMLRPHALAVQSLLTRA